jgi:hypothetical protein
MHRSLIPGTGSSPTRTPSASSTFGTRFRGAVFFSAVFRCVFFFAIVVLFLNAECAETQRTAEIHAIRFYFSAHLCELCVLEFGGVAPQGQSYQRKEKR